MTNAPQITTSVAPSLVTTTNGSSTVTILSVPFHDTTGGQLITFDVVGYDFSNNDIATAKLSVRVKNVAGTLTLVGTPVHTVPINAGSSSALINAALSVVISGSNVNLNVIGVADRTIKWVGYLNPGVEVLNSWTAVPTPADGYVNVWNAANTRWEPGTITLSNSSVVAGGDLTGFMPNPLVYKLTGNSGSIRIGTAAIASTYLYQADASSSPDGGSFQIKARDAESGTANNGADMYVTAGSSGNGTGTGDGGDLYLTGGASISTAAVLGGTININGGSNSAGTGGAVNLTVGNYNSGTKGSLGINVTSTTSANAGANGDVPAQVVGYITVKINGTDRKIPYYDT